METFHLVKDLNKSEAVKTTIMQLLKRCYPEEFIEIENVIVNPPGKVGYESVV